MRAATLGSILAVYCAWLAACDCRAGLPELFYDDLQTACDGAPCDWQVEAGSATTVATVHSKEHGMRLTSGTRITHALDFAIVGASSPQEAPQIHALAACDGAATRLRFFVELQSGDATVPLEASFAEAPDDDAPLPLRQIDLLGPDGSAPGDGRAVRFIIEVDGPDDCVIDELRIVEKTVVSDC